MHKILFCVFVFSISHTGMIAAQGLGGSGFSGGGWGSPSISVPSTPPSTPTSPTIVNPSSEPDIIMTPESLPFPVDVGSPEPMTGPDGWWPYIDPNNPPELPGGSGNHYCGPAAVCGGTPSNGIPPSVNPSTPAPQPAHTPQYAVVKSNNGFPSIVALTGGSGRLCTGVIVSSRLVLTAAHCGTVDT